MTRSTSFPSHAQLLMIRHESVLRKHALATFGPQGVLDLALLGAILGNNIREIGRFKVTCDGNLVQGRYTIYELVHFGALSVTGRRRESKAGPCDELRRSSVVSAMSEYSSCTSSSGVTTVSTSTSASTETVTGTTNTAITTTTTTTTTTSAGLPRIYPATLANLFPAMVFKALRKKSIRPPKYQHDDSASATPISSTFHFEGATNSSPVILEVSASAVEAISSAVDPMLITCERVLSRLAQQGLHRVKDLPLPRELCFLGAVSLPLPPVLRAMHVAWTMDFLNTRATTTRRQRRQQQQQQQQQEQQALNPVDTTATTGTMATGGLEFRPDVYAHKMRVARLARAQQQQQHSASTRSGPGANTNAVPSSTSIPEENEDEEEEEEKNEPCHMASSSTTVASLVATSKNLQPRSKSLTINTEIASSLSSSSTAVIASQKSMRQDKRLMQQLLSLENKVPRMVRQWAVAARPCFDEELLQEDRQVQEWVDRQRIQVVLGCGYSRLGGGSGVGGSLNSTTNASSSFSQRRPVMPSPISTTLANSIIHNSNSGHSHAGLQHHRAPPSPLSMSLTMPLRNGKASQSSSFPHPPLSGTRVSFPDGVPLGSSPRGTGTGTGTGVGNGVGAETETLMTAGVPSRPASGSMAANRLSASQQMLSMHLWLSLLVSPLSPEHMVQDQFGFMDA